MLWDDRDVSDMTAHAFQSAKALADSRSPPVSVHGPFWYRRESYYVQVPHTQPPPHIHTRPPPPTAPVFLHSPPGIAVHLGNGPVRSRNAQSLHCGEDFFPGRTILHLRVSCVKGWKLLAQRRFPRLCSHLLAQGYLSNRSSSGPDD